MIALFAVLICFTCATPSALHAAICDSNYKVSVFDCHDADTLAFQIEVVAVFNTGAPDTTSQWAANHESTYPKPSPSSVLTGAYVGGVWYAFGTTTNVEIRANRCIEIRIFQDAGGCFHIHIRCLDCIPVETKPADLAGKG